MINFTWWVNRKNRVGKHLLRADSWASTTSASSIARGPAYGSSLEQADGTAWMAFYGPTMVAMAMELAAYDPLYEDVATKFVTTSVE